MVVSPLQNRSTAQRVAIVLAVILQLGSTSLPALGYGEPIGDRSDAVRTLITPAGWAFSIWGFLYAGSVLFALWQLLPGQANNRLLDRIGWWAAGTFAGNGVWAIYTQFADLTFVSAIIIAFNLVCSLVVLHWFVVSTVPFKPLERWLAVLPLSALAAWLSAATIVNISAALEYHGVLHSGTVQPLIAAATVMVGGVIAAAAVARSRGNPWYALVFLWALLAIFLRGGQQETVVAAATVLSAVMVIFALFMGLGQRGNRHHWFG